MFERFNEEEIISYSLRPVFACIVGAFLAAWILCFVSNIFYAFLSLVVFAIFAKKIFSKEFSKFIITLIIVFFHGWYFLYNQDGNSKLPNNFSVVAKVEVREFSSPVGIDWLEMPYYTNAELMELRFSQYDKSPINANIPVVVVFKNRNLKFSYGDIQNPNSPRDSSLWDWYDVPTGAITNPSQNITADGVLYWEKIDVPWSYIRINFALTAGQYNPGCVATVKK